ncbi:MAG: mannose-1-phosphate guanylyltransferase/mannose-6-phosphate isomerase [Terricaulis sp.]
MKHRIIPAIMSGGSGTRLWPASTESKPKQFHAIKGEGSMIVQTIERVFGDTDALSFLPPLILCNAQHDVLAAEQLAEAGYAPAAIVLEPMGRNTAATAAIAAALTSELAPDALVLLLPADHVIDDPDAFRAAIERAAPFARERIVTFGIEPDRPETGYGYIKRGAALGEGVFEVAAFREKPNEATARDYIAEGSYSWNAGMFFFHPDVLLKEFDASPQVRDASLEALRLATRSGNQILLDAEAFAKAPSLPLDIAVMEKTSRAAVAPCDIGWADVGSWDEIWRVSDQDENGNAAHGRVVIVESSNNLVRSEGPKICIAGLEDLVVIATADAVMILPRARAQDVKLLRELALKLD